MATTIDTGTNQLLASRNGDILTLTLNRPEARNALSENLTPALRAMLACTAEDDSIGALIITGAGKAFCAGGDVKGMETKAGELVMTLEERITQLQQRQRTLTGVLTALPQPTIAALPGPAVGAGMAIALACDIRIAARSSFLSTGYLNVALSGDYGISWLITRLAGTARARELMFTGERLDAERCEQIGLVNQVVPDEDLQEVAKTMATTFADGPRTALRMMKENLDLAIHADFLTSLDHEAAQLIASSQNSDHQEAISAFIDKRPPNFSK